MTALLHWLLQPLQLAVGWTLAILIALSIPADALPNASSPLGTDKAIHAGLFGLFGVLWLRVAWRTVSSRWRVYASVLGGGVLFGVATEGYQHWMPLGRQGDPYDVLANTCGLLAAIGGYALYQRIQPQSDPQGCSRKM